MWVWFIYLFCLGFYLQWLKGFSNLILFKMWEELMKMLHISITLIQIISSSFLDVENVHLEFGNVTLLDVVDVSQLTIIKAQAMVWKLHNCMFICWGFFVMNNGLLVNSVNLQNLLRCIICRSRSKHDTPLNSIIDLITSPKVKTAEG
jgi:hypothetical protein